ncbi:hypothetical protein E2562_022865 [Oryza meyeriana var. granulata]|uniref:Uncharacterized protein n=1 Tax=Oryza meyeriana var. granulata TaxID=110450 RepID=A0A6G1BLU5_9ORYZ|nr:hypothetical protein E2562_022865 [Oryza meyeriana var. granulata]
MSEVSRDNTNIGYVERVPDNEETAAMMMPEEMAHRPARAEWLRNVLHGRGHESMGTTYNAVLDGRLVVTVKRLDATKIGAAAPEAEAFAKEERLLIYDYQPNGSLYSLIHEIKPTIGIRAPRLRSESVMADASTAGAYASMSKQR